MSFNTCVGVCACLYIPRVCSVGARAGFSKPLGQRDRQGAGPPLNGPPACPPARPRKCDFFRVDRQTTARQ